MKIGVFDSGKGGEFIMQPGDFVLAVTHEHVKIPADLMGRLEGRSSLGRLGLVVHSTASIFLEAVSISNMFILIRFLLNFNEIY